MAQLKHTTPPVSKTVQRLLAQIHAEAEAATLAALSAKDGIVTLHGVDRESTRIYHYMDGDMRWYDANGNSVWLHRMRAEPECWRGQDHMAGRWRPGQWDVSLNFKDGLGREWLCELGAHITDDFGTLVPVGGAA